ncbi:CAP domain-containing protein [Salinibacterium sp. ZJ70]|uniref:CAP domain-containing protein n=1 Tax=Salinibacterium sp. ZJ70 TaxID=2708084 RepID=UPI00141E7C79|nr:CAP domain-containing protein [Salinibacterium sp. ZJ70]
MDQHAAALDIEPACPDAVPLGAPARPGRPRLIVALAIGVVLVAAAGIAALAMFLQQAAHAEALASAEEARADAVAAVADERAAIEVLQSRAEDAAALRSSVVANMLPHAGALGGDAALAPVAEALTLLGATLDGFASAEGDPVVVELREAPPVREVPSLDPEASTDDLAELADRLIALATQARASRALLSGDAGELARSMIALESEMRSLIGSLAATHEALLAARTLAPEGTRAAATLALQAIQTADVRDVPALAPAYATAVTGVIAAHDAEVARIAAEEAARQAAQAARSGSRIVGSGGGSGGSGSGGGGTASNGVLSATNDQRAANGRAALAWSGSLATRACSWASYLADGNKDLSHSSGPGGLWGENVAYGPKSASGVVDLWMGSTGHRENILRDGFTKMGACSAASSTGRVYWVQQFG